MCGGSCVSYQLPQYCCKKKKNNQKNLRDPQQILFSSWLCRDSAGLGWFWLILAGLDCVSAVSWSCLSLLRYLGNSCMIAGPEWPHLNILGTQLCLICLSSSIRLVGGILWGWWQRHKEKETSVCKSISSLCIISATISLAKAGHMAKERHIRRSEELWCFWPSMTVNKLECVFVPKGIGFQILTVILWVVSEVPQTSISDSCLRGQFQMISDNSRILWRKGMACEVTVGRTVASPLFFLKEKKFFLSFLYI